MKEFINFYNSKANSFGWKLEIYHSSIMDWCITVDYKTTHSSHGDTVVRVQDSDVDFAFAKAQILLKDWLLEHEGGY